MPIPWTASLMIGHAALDSDHERIIALINQLEAMILDSAGFSAISSKYGQIVDNLCEHFLKEEQIMSTIKFKEIDKHIAYHGALFERLTKLMVSIENKEPNSNHDTLEFLQDWFFNHVMVADKKIGQHILDCGC